MNSEELRDIRHLFIECCPSLPKPQDVEFWSAVRKKRTKSLLGLYGRDGLKEKLFDKVEKSDFLTNRSGKWSGCSFDWIIKPENVQKIVEGNYDNRDADKPNQHSYDIEAAIKKSENVPNYFDLKKKRRA